MALLQDLRRDLPPGMVRPIGRKPEGSKADRMLAQSAKIEAGHVDFMGRGNADGIGKLIDEDIAWT